ncbi:MAG: hypothetical protein ABI488_03050 [Polyangiaceae bacterium]
MQSDEPGASKRPRAIDLGRENGVRAQKVAHLGQFARRLRGGALFALVWGAAVACGGGTPSEPLRDGSGDLIEPVVPCGEDEVREYFCDDLLPLTSSRPAPEPYDNCPAATDIRPGKYPALGKVAVFDQSRTAYTRERRHPGHACCYGWCAKVKLSDASKAGPSACRDATGDPEHFCMAEPEGGTSTPAAAPFNLCPVAVKPPDGVAFASPVSAYLDARLTTQERRDKKLAQCCYGWCAILPGGVIVKTHPKIK